MSKEFLAACRKFGGRPASLEDAQNTYQSMSQDYRNLVPERVFTEFMMESSRGSFLMHDYEGGGISGIKSGATQFASVRVNMELEPIDLPIDYYCKPNLDRLPSLEAVIITRISPLHCLKHGVSEFEFFKMINLEMSLPNTCSAGYNSASYDDEMSRSGFFANLLPVYDREWKNGNTRWDLYRIAMAYYALRPDGIIWPEGKEGSPVSMRLEDIAAANGIVQANAHNAVDDVFAMIDVCRLFMKANRKLWDYLFINRTKAKVQAFVSHSLSQSQPLIYINPFAGAKNKFTKVIMPLSCPLGDKNEVSFIDLKGDIDKLVQSKPESVRELLFAKKDTLEDLNEERPCLGKFKVNQIPLIIPFSVLRDDTSRERLDVNTDALKIALDKVQNGLSEIEFITMEVYRNQSHGKDNPYVEDQVYSAGFPAKMDSDSLSRIQYLTTDELAGNPTFFHTPILNELQQRLIYLHSPDLAPSQDIIEFKEQAKAKLCTPKDERVTLPEIKTGLAKLAKSDEPHVKALVAEYEEYLSWLEEQLG